MTLTLRAAAALMLSACSLVGATAAEAKTLDVTILGDSYSSGVGGGDTTGGPCYRSPNTWGQVYGGLARAKGLTVNVNNLACGGATLDNTNPLKNLTEQIKTVPDETDLVLLTIGGNDAGFGEAVAFCFAPVLAGSNVCRSAMKAGRESIPENRDLFVTALEKLGTKLGAGPKVVVLGYPYLALPSGYLLGGWGPTYDSGAAMRLWGDELEAATVSAAAQANDTADRDFVTFVSTKAQFAGHEPDPNPWQQNPQRWILEWTALPEPVDFYHPSPLGHQVMGQAAFAQAGPGGDFGVSK